METVCQPSYPLNSENARPFGTRTVYLAWAVSCAEMALPPKTAGTETASETTTITTAGILLLFIATLLVAYWLPVSSAFCLQQSLYWHEHRSTLLLDQEHQEFRRLGTACVPVNDMNIVGAFIEGLSWCQCYLFSTLQLHHNGAL